MGERSIEPQGERKGAKTTGRGVGTPGRGVRTPMGGVRTHGVLTAPGQVLERSNSSRGQW